MPKIRFSPPLYLLLLRQVLKKTCVTSSSSAVLCLNPWQVPSFQGQEKFFKVWEQEDTGMGLFVLKDCNFLIKVRL